MEKAARGEQIAWTSLLALVILVPLSMGNLRVYGLEVGSVTYDQFDLIKLSIVRILCLIGCMALLYAYVWEGLRPRWSPVLWFYLAFIGLVVLSTLFSIDPATALMGKYRRYEGLLTFILYGMVFLMAFQLLDGPKRVRTLCLALVASGTLVSFYGVAQYFGFDPISWGSLSFESNRAFATYGNPVMLGSFVIFPLTCAAALALTETNPKLKIALWISVVINALACFATFTRASWIAVALGLLALALILRSQGYKTQTLDRVFLGIFAGLLLVFVVYSTVTGSGVTDITHRLASLFNLQSGSTSSRIEIWRASWNATLERPLLGWGADTLRLVFPMFKTPEYSQVVNALSVADNAHNYPLQLMVGVGIPATVMIAMFFCLPLLNIRTVLSTRSPGLLALYITIPAYLINMLASLSLVGTTTFLYIALGAVLAVNSRSLPSFQNVYKGTKRIGSTLLFVSASIVAVLLMVLTLQQVVADHYYLQARSAEGEKQITNYDLAIKLNSLNGQYQTQRGYALLNQYNDALRSAHTSNQADSVAEQAYERARTELEKVRNKHPYEFDNNLFLASLYNTRAKMSEPDSVDYTQAHKAASSLTTQAIEQWPNAAPMRLQYAQVLKREGKYEAAQEQISYALMLDPDYEAAQNAQGEPCSE